jgi:Mce-associated membrane protein
VTTPEEPIVAADTEAAANEAVQASNAETQTVETTEAENDKPKHGISWTRVLAYGVLPAVALLLALGAGFLKWIDVTGRDEQTARTESVRMATESTVAMLSYKADTVEKDLGAAQGRLTGGFKDSYNALTHDVVIPGAKEKQISAMARVPAAASASASANHAVVLVFVDQTVVIGTDPPADTASSVRVTLDKIGGRWLISDFTPV